MKSMTYLVNVFKRNGDMYDNLNKFFKSDDGSNYVRFLNYLSNASDLQKKYKKPICLEKLENANNWGFLRNIPLSKILFWNCLYFTKYITELSQFEKLKSDFENLLLSHKYNECLEVLETIKKQFGVSLWLIENYIILGTFDTKIDDYEKLFENKALGMFRILKIKNNVNEQNSYYCKRISSLFENSDLSEEFKNYYKYKLYFNIDFNELDWCSILLVETNYSLIDLYITTKICLQYMRTSRKINVSKNIDECYRIIDAINSNCNADSLEVFTKMFDDGEYENVVKYFFGEDFDLYDIFGTYKLVALSLLGTDKNADDLPNVISSRIVKDVFCILSRGECFVQAIDDLCTLSRVLQPFNINQSITVFISLIKNDNASNFIEQCYTFGDAFMLNYELGATCPLLLPYKSMYMPEEQDVLSDIEEFLGVRYDDLNEYLKNYFIEAQIRLKIKKLIKEENLTEATVLLVQAYTKNMFLVYSNDIYDIRKNLKSKLEPNDTTTAKLSLEECCYIFIDPEFTKFRRTCFLNFLDDNFNEPLDVLKVTTFNQNVVRYFLHEICDINMLSKIYWLYNSTDEAINYRIKICKYLLENSTINQKEIELELEELTKNIALKKHLQDVDKSRISIDAESFKSNTINELNENVNLYNISNKFDYYEIGTIMKVAFLSDPVKDVLKKMYYHYAQEFCFGDNGIDTSLSTRVRHGTLSNQILRTFADNSLHCNGHGSNPYFDKHISNNYIDSEIRRKLLDFADKIQQHLNNITQCTLKVFINKPISGAVFNYNLTEEEEYEIYNKFIECNKLTVDNFIDVVYPLLIKKTNGFLEQIRSVEMPKLRAALVDELDYFYQEIQPIVKNQVVLKEVESKIANCKTTLQAEFNAITKWFYITEIQNWEDFDIDVLLDMCMEIEKKLFSGFELVKISRATDNTKYKGKVFRYFIDIFLILFHNAIIHSGYREELSNLEINFSVSTDSHSVYFVVENNLLDPSRVEVLNPKFEKYNDDYNNFKFLEINTRQEGGMGLYKIMSMLYSATKQTDMFYITTVDNKVRVEIKIKKELICNE